MTHISRQGLIVGVLAVYYSPIIQRNAFAQKQSAATSNIDCVERLEIPEYPQLPRMARIQGTQTVLVVLSDRASVLRIESKSRTEAGRTNTYFKAAAENAIKHSAFLGSCAGKSVALMFHYEISKRSSNSPFAFEYPNHFWIRTPQLLMMPESSIK
jgi:hypothetical protein